MRGKLIFIVGLGIGYVLGARAGRQRYEQIASAAEKLWNSPAVQKPRAEISQFVETQAPKVADAVTDAAGSAIKKVTGRGGKS